MGKLAKKHEQAIKAIASFEQALNQYNKWQHTIDRKKVEELGIDYEGAILNFRDSSIQRFEYSIDILWKYLKTYLDEKLDVVPEMLSPSTIIRETARARVISEQEAESLLMMMKKRNLTSHMYNEELVDDIIKDFSSFLTVMQEVIQRVV